MDKIAIIVQRYSEDVNGGAELHARLLAERLAGRYKVEVLTSCAKDYVTWDNYYPEGVSELNGVTVRKFRTDHPRDHSTFRKWSHKLHSAERRRNRLTKSGFIRNLFNKTAQTSENKYEEVFAEWLRQQGPYCPGLIDYVSDNKDSYKVFIFFTYLYYPTWAGIQAEGVGQKSILIPTAHDERQLYFKGFRHMFYSAGFIMYNMDAERDLVERVYPGVLNIPSDTAGLGFEKQEADAKMVSFQRPAEKYVVYIGRIDPSKGCKILLNYFIRYRKKHPEPLKLVLIGNNFMGKEAEHDDIIYTGFISDDDKVHLLEGSEALIIPSRFESLSMVTLEAMKAGKPVLANESCAVLKSHIDKSGAGGVFRNAASFDRELSALLALSETQKKEMSAKGVKYVDENYSWDGVMEKFDRAISHISDKTKTKK